MNVALHRRTVAVLLSLALVLGFSPFAPIAHAATSSGNLQSQKESLDSASAEKDKVFAELQQAQSALTKANNEVSSSQSQKALAEIELFQSQNSLKSSIAASSARAADSKDSAATRLDNINREYQTLISQSGASYNESDIEDISNIIVEKENVLSSVSSNKSKFLLERDSYLARYIECSNNISVLERDIEEIEEEIKELQWERISSEMNSAQQEYEPVKNDYEAASNKRSETLSEYNRLRNEAGKIYAEELSAGTKKKEAAEKVESAKAEYEAYRESTGATEEQKVLSLREYLESKGASSAVREFDYRQGWTGEVKEVTDATMNATPNDATDYRNVLKSLQSIKDTNKVRESLGLSTLLVSDRLMARETVSANWSANVISHSDGCGNENLTWVDTNSPVEQWYDREKSIYERALNEGMYKDQKLPDGWKDMSHSELVDLGFLDFTIDIGHYFNMINPDHLYVGAALNTMEGKKYPRVWGQVYASIESLSDSATVEQWESDFISWVEKQLELRPDLAAFEKYRDVQCEYEEACEYYELQYNRGIQNAYDVDAAKKEYNEAVAAYNEIAPKYDEALAAYQPVKDAYDAAKESYDPLASELSRLEESLSSLATEKEVFEARIEALDKEIEYCDETISRTTSELEALKEESTTAYAIAEKAREVSTAQAAYDKAASDLAYITSFDAQGALAGNGKKTELAAFASLDADIATCAVKTAAYNKASDKYDSAVATRDAAASRVASAQSDYERSLVSYNSAKAAYDAAYKEASRVSLSSVSATLSADALTYTGSAITPTVKLTYAGKTLVQGRDYTLTRATACKAVGTHKLTVTGIGAYKGSRTLSFKINPQGATIKKLSAGKGQVTVSLSKKSSNIKGFKVKYSKNKSMSSAKTVTVKKSATSKVVKSLTKNKTYYFQVRTYKKVSGKTYYSAWSAKKSVKVKAK